ncbi:hypothetical protein [Bacillus rubiinfantis]|uniref:hypothetical protein n=1 Tax=Bacillus rubiinfantis TaxID=1499680 RepID=UPI0005A72DE1|nr:hypothetical protein [Bacillus rubiinfantis]
MLTFSVNQKQVLKIEDVRFFLTKKGLYTEQNVEKVWNDCTIVEDGDNEQVALINTVAPSLKKHFPDSYLKLTTETIQILLREKDIQRLFNKDNKTDKELH